MVMAGLTFPSQLYSSGVVAYTAISQVRNMGSSFGTWYWLFKFQESRYIVWGMSHKACSPGGLHESQMPRIVYNTILQALSQINEVLKDKDGLCKRYGMQEIGDIRPVEHSLIRRESLRQQNMVKRLQKSSSLFRKVQWAVKDQGRFAELVQQLTGLINILYEMLPVTGGPLVGDTIAAETLAETLINRGWGGVEGLQQTTDPQLRELREMERAMDSAVHREANEISIISQPISPSQHLVLDMQQLEFLDSGSVPNSAPHVRSWARPKHGNAFSGQDFLVVEWRWYDPQRGREEMKRILHGRIQALAVMFKEKPRTDSFRVFDCIGYFEDNSDTRFGLTFRLPNDYDPRENPAPMSLYQLIDAYRENIPYLGERFRLAHLLAESLHALHASGWLHKSISSHNILLLQKKPYSMPSGDQQRPISLENPYFTGFAASRPDNPGEESSKSAADREFALYCHPDVAGYDGQAVAGYRAIYDIYSLGLVLIEIGTWRSLARWSPKHAAATLDFKRLLLDKIVPCLGASMGENYMIAVKKCLEGSFERIAGFSEDEYNSADYKNNVRQGLLWEVVTVLRDCRA
jgi:hypothetical protein